MDKQELFENLLDRYHSGKSTEEEVRQMLELLEEDPELYRLLDQRIDRDWWSQSIVFNPGLADSSPMRRKRENIWLRAAAACLAIVMIAGGIWWWSSAHEEIHYATTFGERQKIELPDGSRVELNANSKLTWNKDWVKTGKRMLTLSGEAYFEVTSSDKAREFMVMTDGGTVKVLGTSFNVASRDGNMEVFLEQGLVTLYMPDHTEHTMSPGEKIQYKKDRKEIRISEEETLYSAAAWKMGVISYQNMPLKEILPDLSDIYGIDVVCPDAELNEKIMDVGVPYMDWEATKESLELAMEVTIEKKDNVYIIKNKN